jgi:flavorubredoxin
MNTELAKGVNWVGHIDWSVRDFHGYRTERGSSYNAYLVEGAQVALIDTVKAPYAATLLGQVRERLGERPLRYLVCNHAEPDHAGAMAAVVAAFPGVTVVCNAKCREALGLYGDTAGWTFQVVKEGTKLDLGGRTLQFFDTPMVHWPESMATYLIEEQILFSMDAFGQHYASGWRFDDEAPMDEVMHEAKTYYANIVLPFVRPVTAALAKLGTLPLKQVAPSHGVIWRSHIADIVRAYQDWVVSQAAKKVVILFCTMWDSTRLMAEAVAEGAMAEAVTVKLIDVNATADTDIVAEVMDCAALAVGSATLNMGIMPRLAATMTYLRGLKPVGKAGFAFGSCGWATKGAEEVAAYLGAMQVEILHEPITCRFRPDAATLARCREAGRLLAKRALTTG